jgi:hypothetical protein
MILFGLIEVLEEMPFLFFAMSFKEFLPTKMANLKYCQLICSSNKTYTIRTSIILKKNFLHNVVVVKILKLLTRIVLKTFFLALSNVIHAAWPGGAVPLTISYTAEKSRSPNPWLLAFLNACI